MLKEEDIAIGKIIWYSGFTSTSGWDCPAEIIQINFEKKTFRVKSLDDMKEQSQDYDFEVTEHSPLSRKSMYVPDLTDVRVYLNAKASAYDSRILRLQDEIRSAETSTKLIRDYLLRSDMQPPRV